MAEPISIGDVHPVRRTGCKPTPRTVLARASFMPRYLTSLPVPPASFDATKDFGGFRMFLNDTLGDCVIAENANAIRGLTYATYGTPVEISDADVRTDYFAQTGGADTGLSLGENLAYENAHGLIDAQGRVHKPGPYGTVDPTHIGEFAKASFYFRRLKLAVAAKPLNDYLDQGGQMDGLLKYTGTKRSDIDHCVGVYGRKLYSSGSFWKLVTWGGVIWVNDDFIVNCCGEAWATYAAPDAFLDGKTFDGFSQDDLMADWDAFNGRPPKPKADNGFTITLHCSKDPGEVTLG